MLCTYDALGRRISRKDVEESSTDYFYYDGNRIVEVYCPHDHGEFQPRQQYVWGLHYIDELIAQTDYPSDPDDPAQAEYFVLQDANYNVVALADASTGGLAGQYSYKPYGQLLAAEDGTGAALSTDPATPFLHQGLWYDYLVDIIHNRGREYHPQLGRFIQRDPNQTTLVVADVLAHNAQTMSVFASLSIGSQYADGLSLYGYLASNPITRRDPNGLFSDIWGEVDDIAAHYFSDRVATQIEMIARAKRMMGVASSVLVNMAMEMIPESIIAAIRPETLYMFGVLHTVEAGYAMYREGVSWGGVAGLAAQLYGLKAMAGVHANLGIKMRKGQSRAAGLGLDVDRQSFNAHLGDGRRAYRGIKIGSFSIRSWDGYPAGLPRPKGPFRLLSGAEYNAARKAADGANKRLRRTHPEKYAGKQIHEIHPVKYGGSPTDPANKIALPPSVHRQYNTFWHKLQRQLEAEAGP